jgi:hypothetical protein
MAACLCCSKNLPASDKKVCPLCGHSLMGHGWWGIDYHWQVRHEKEIPFSAFWAGLCAAHRNTQVNENVSNRQAAVPQAHPEVPDSVHQAYNKVVARRSRHAKNLLMHPLISAIAEVLWNRDHWLDLQASKEDVDHHGFDLVLHCNGSIRFIHIEQTFLSCKTNYFAIKNGLFNQVGGCVVVLVYRPDTFELDHALFFGGSGGTVMPTMAVSSGQNAAGGMRPLRKNYQEVPRRLFTAPLSISELVDHLFPVNFQSKSWIPETKEVVHSYPAMDPSLGDAMEPGAINGRFIDLPT